MAYFNILLLSALVVSAHSFSCPSYDELAQDSVAPSVYQPSDLDGLWYMLATNEPTLPPICDCPRNNFTMNVDEGTYAYTNIDFCQVTGEVRT